jgi:hypothetical protein
MPITLFGDKGCRPAVAWLVIAVSLKFMLFVVHAVGADELRAASPGGGRQQEVTLTRLSSAERFDIQVHGVHVSAVIDALRSQHCVPVSFAMAEGEDVVTLDLHKVTAGAVLSAIASQLHQYNAEALKGRLVLYPAAAEYQAVVRDVTIHRVPRFTVADQYILLLRRRVPGFERLALPSLVTVALGVSPLIDEPVSVRKSGRVIEQFVDLLGSLSRVYFDIAISPTGIPAFGFATVDCIRDTPLVEIVPCPAGDKMLLILNRTSALNFGEQRLSQLFEQLRARERVPISLIEGLKDPLVAANLRGVTIGAALQRILAQVPELRCMVSNNHIVLFPSEPSFQLKVTGVKIRLMAAGVAANEYVRRLVSVPEFRDVHPYVEPPGDQILRSTEVSLSPEGTVVEHLIELLGNDEEAYFVLSASKDGRRVLKLAALPENGEQ